MRDLFTLRRAAREIFDEALKQVDAGRAVRRAVHLSGTRLTLVNTTLHLSDYRAGVYCVALGKAARPMAAALSEILKERLTGLVESGVKPIADCGLRNPNSQKRESLFFNPQSAIRNLKSARPQSAGFYRVFEGGHPLPNRESLEAAQAAFDLLSRADESRALVVFLISGGGSAMMERPRDASITLEELRTTNEALVSCGASIAEINSVRRAISAVKGGGLSAHASHCDQVSLIVSDTGSGCEATVASGPTFDPPADAPDASSIVKDYKLEERLPQSVLRAIKQAARPQLSQRPHKLRAHYVLLDNEDALRSAAEAAMSRGFAVEIARDIVEQAVAEGCSTLLAKLSDLRSRTATDRSVCLISGGEFACPVRGRGVGGRNAETALRWAIESEARAALQSEETHRVALSAGTDGIDGNSPAAGAIADEGSVSRACALGLDPRAFLDESDAYTFFNALGETVMTGATGTNVRDLRIMLAG